MGWDVPGFAVECHIHVYAILLYGWLNMVKVKGVARWLAGWLSMPPRDYRPVS
jgi:hypothetical protein